MPVTAALDSIDRLRRLADRAALEWGDEWLSDAVRRMEASPGLTIGAAIGLEAPGTSWRTLDRKRARNRLIRHMAEHFFPRMPVEAASAAIADEMTRYERNWHRDCAFPSAPVRYAGTIRQFLFEIFRAGTGNDRSLSASQIKRILEQETTPSNVETRMAV